jgi:hypothetical protein
VGRRLELTLHLGLGQAQRFDLSDLFGVNRRRRQSRLSALLLALLHPLGEARLRVY